MQVNIDKKTGTFLGIIAILLLTVLALVLQRSDEDDSSPMNSAMSMEMNASSFTGADVMFLQMMIPHHQQAIDISNIALKTSKDSELLALAKTIIGAQTAEIIQMQAWLHDSNSNSRMGHSMDGMGGMLDDAELSALSAATGSEFDRLWLKGMIGHHDGAIHMTQMIEDASNLEIKSFGEKVVKDQSAQITQMKAMLKRIG